MRKGICSATSILAGTLMLVGGIATSGAQPSFTKEKVSFESQTSSGAGVSVRGELQLPDTGEARLPAVLVLHSSSGSGHDRHSGPFIELLNRAGIATLWIDMFPDRSSRPRSTRDSMPKVFGSLLYLAAHARIDPQRIGVMGFSWGGVVSLLTVSQELVQEYVNGKAQFAAHLGFYPVCWAQQQVLSGSNRMYGAGTYQQVTGAPVHILAGEQDDYDEPDSCPKFVAALPEEVRKHFGVTVYPGAYHSFDAPIAPSKSYDRYANAGRGGSVRLGYEPKAAAQSRAFTVEFFSKHLAKN